MKLGALPKNRCGINTSVRGVCSSAQSGQQIGGAGNHRAAGKPWDSCTQGAMGVTEQPGAAGDGDKLLRGHWQGRGGEGEPGVLGMGLVVKARWG